MKEIRLKFTKTDKGIYIYLTTEEKDVLITEVMISRQKDQMLLVDGLNLIDFRLLAYRHYITLLKTISETLKDDEKYTDLQQMINTTLSKFQE